MKQWCIQRPSGGRGNLATPESYPPCRMSWYHGELCRPVNRCVSVSEHIGVAERCSFKAWEHESGSAYTHGGLNRVARNKRSSSFLWRIHPRVGFLVDSQNKSWRTRTQKSSYSNQPTRGLSTVTRKSWWKEVNLTGKPTEEYIMPSIPARLMGKPSPKGEQSTLTLTMAMLCFLISKQMGKQSNSLFVAAMKLLFRLLIDYLGGSAVSYFLKF